MLAEPNGVFASRQERREVRPHGDGSDTGPATAVGDAERLVQVEVTDVGTEHAGLGEPDKRVQVGAVDVHLATGIVDHGADVTDPFLEHAVRGRVGEHDRRHAIAVGVEVARQVTDVDVALVVATDDGHVHAGEHGACSVGAVRARGDEAARAGEVATLAVVGAHGEQSGELALTAGVGLQADGVVARDRDEHLRQLVDHREVTRHRLRGGERVHL
jgi:hypothetical protein